MICVKKLFKDMQIKMTFRTQNTIQNRINQTPKTYIFNKNYYHQMKCLGCPQKYIGQTGRTFNTRCQEHVQTFRNNNNNSGYSSHILNTGHTHGIIQCTMDIIRTHEKRKYLNTLEKYHIYKISKNNVTHE
jgi:hypothetical protein